MRLVAFLFPLKMVEDATTSNRPQTQAVFILSQVVYRPSPRMWKLHNANYDIISDLLEIERVMLRSLKDACVCLGRVVFAQYRAATNEVRARRSLVYVLVYYVGIVKNEGVELK